MVDECHTALPRFSTVCMAAVAWYVLQHLIRTGAEWALNGDATHGGADQEDEEQDVQSYGFVASRGGSAACFGGGLRHLGCGACAWGSSGPASEYWTCAKGTVKPHTRLEYTRYLSPHLLASITSSMALFF